MSYSLLAALAAASAGGYTADRLRSSEKIKGLSDREWKRRKRRRKMQRESRKRNR